MHEMAQHQTLKFRMSDFGEKHSVWGQQPISINANLEADHPLGGIDGFWRIVLPKATFQIIY